MDLGEIGREVVNWMHLSHCRIQRWNHGQEKNPSGSLKGRKFLE